MAQQAGVVRSDLAVAEIAGALETLALALLVGAVQFGMIGDEGRPAAIIAILWDGLRGASGT
jgi:hypothetical protein